MGGVRGINEDGLVASLSCGGRRDLGQGFGVPIIIRYVLQTCSTVGEAIEALQSIPTHMSYNVTVLDRAGARATVEITPHGCAVFMGRGYAANHQSHDRERTILDADVHKFGT